MEKIELTVVDNQVLRGNCWEIENPKACVVIFTGMEETISRYDEFAKFLNANGYSVYGLDTYGQGENVAEDLSNIGVWPDEGFGKQVIAHNMLVNKLKEEGKTVYIFSHSMGSFMCQDYIQRFPGSVDKVVICGTGYKVPAGPIALLLCKIVANKTRGPKKAKFLNKLMFGNFNNKIENPKTEYDWLSWNEENVQKYIADPKCGFGPNNHFCYEFVRGMTRLFKKNSLRKINKDQKIFLISGDGDPVTNYGKYTAKVEQMYKKLGIKCVQKKIYPHMRHEILNEDNRAEVMNDILAFYEA